MKIILSFLRRLLGLGMGILSLAFIIIQGQRLLSGEWRLYEHAFIAFGQTSLRLLLALLALWLSGCILLKKRCHPLVAVCLFAGCIAMAPFLSNHFGLFLPILSALLFLSNVNASKKTEIR